METDPCSQLDDALSVESSAKLETPDGGPVDSMLAVQFSVKNKGDIAIALGTLRYFLPFPNLVKQEASDQWMAAAAEDFRVRCLSAEIVKGEEVLSDSLCDSLNIRVQQDKVVIGFSDDTSLCAGCTLQGIEGGTVLTLRHQHFATLQTSTEGEEEVTCQETRPTPSPAPLLSPEEAAKEECRMLVPTVTVSGYPDEDEASQTDGFLNQFADFEITVQNQQDSDVELDSILIPIRYIAANHASRFRQATSYLFIKL